MSKSKIKFNASHKNEFPFLSSDPKGESNVWCTWCKTSFSIATGGRSRIIEHVNSKRHSDSAKIVKNHQTIENHFAITTSKAELQTAATELAYTYHVAKHGIAFRTTECSSSLFALMFDKNYQCAKTKSAAIATNVIGPMITEEVKSDLESMSFLTLMTDASNRKDVKLLPVLARGFHQEKGILIYKLEVYFIDNEKAVTICDLIIKTAEKWNIKNKIVGFSADNCNTNFGGPRRNGTNNVFSLLKQKIGRDLFGLGCLFHVTGNSVEAATEVLPHDVTTIVEKIYKHFYIHAVRRATLEDLCAEAEVTYKTLTRQSNVRPLTMLSSVQRVAGK
jgi:hypothetical protein